MFKSSNLGEQSLQAVAYVQSNNYEFKGALYHAVTLVRKVNSSGKATEKLVLLSSKKLVQGCLTQWSSMYLIIKQILEAQNLSVLKERMGQI